MDFSLSETQDMLRTNARDFLKTECPASLVREVIRGGEGYSSVLWRKMADLGWMGLVFPGEYGGSDASFFDLAILLEEMGRACALGPFLSTVVGGLALLEMSFQKKKQKLLAGLARGEIILALAMNEPQTKFEPFSIETRANASGADYIINGTKCFITYAQVADYMVCPVRTEEGAARGDTLSIFLIDSKTQGITYFPLKTIGHDKQCEVVFDNVRVPKENIIGEINEGGALLEKTLQRAAVATCAEMIGGALKVLEMTSSYSKQRMQFGKTIGSFQAIQHHCANMLIDVHGARLITYKAAWKLGQGIPCRKEVAMAKAWVSEAYRRIITLGHQVFAGVGFMEDHDLPLYFRRAKAAEIAFGDAEYHREIVAQELHL
jgi:alkylation response protein AidB-like acyl-CoA dehydrogenase